MTIPLLLRTGFLGLLFLSIGCGSSAPNSEEPQSFSNAAARATPAPAGGVKAAKQPAAEAKVPLSFDPFNAGGAIQQESMPVEAKIIKNATLDVLVANFDEARANLEKLIDSYGAYVAKSDFTGNVGAKRTGVWTVRVPADKFQPFINDITNLGQPQRHVTDAEDVTEEFVDLESDLKNLKEKEAKLNDLMKAKAQSLTDLFTWEKEVFAVRAEIARRQGRLQKLSRLTAMSTVNVTLRDEKEYIPPTKPVYGSSVSGTFLSSFQALSDFGKNILLIVVALAPWAPLLFILALFVRFVIRRVRAAQLLQAASQPDKVVIEMPSD